jgi:N4-gp56 family major capsid protein
MAGQVWSNAADGGYMYSDELSMIMRNQVQPAVRFRQFCDAKDATDKGLGKGQLFSWNVYSDVAQGGGALQESQQMPVTKFTITQQSLTITEYGNSVPYTGKLDNLSKQPVQEIVTKALKNDATKTFDGAAFTQFKASSLKAAPAGGNSATAIVVVQTGSIGVSNNLAMNKVHLKAIGDTMKERNIPAFQGNDYIAIAWPTTFRQIKNDLESIHQYVDQGFRILLNGEIGRYEGIRFIEQTNIAKGGAENAATWTFRNAVPWINGASDWAYFFGEDTVAEALVIPEEIRGKIPVDFGRDRAIAWYYLGGFGIVHSSAGTLANLRILQWASTT